MGTKQIRKRKYFFLHLACLGLIPFVIVGCLHFSKKLQGQKLLEEGMAEMVDRQYEASMAKSVTVLNNFPNSLADQALFQIGLLYAHPENPNQNYQLSLGAFNKILNEFSESRLRPQAQLWILFIEDAIDKKREIGILNKEKVSLASAVEKQQIEITVLQKKIATRKNVDLIDSLENTVAEQKQEIKIIYDINEKQDENILTGIVKHITGDLLNFLSNNIPGYKWFLRAKPPIYVFEFIVKIARLLKNSFDSRTAEEKEVLLNYFSEYFDIVPSRFKQLLDNTIGLAYDHTEIYSIVEKCEDFMNVISVLFNELSKMELISGKKKKEEPKRIDIILR